MHQQPAQPPCFPKSRTRSGHRAGVIGRITTFGFADIFAGLGTMEFCHAGKEMRLHHAAAVSTLSGMRMRFGIRELLRRVKLKIPAARAARNEPYRLRWRSERGRLLPGVNLDSRDHLFDRMDGRL